MTQDFEKHTMDCQKQLRVNPSEYDNKLSFEIDTNETIELLQILFISPNRFSEIHRVELKITQEDEENVRNWLQTHMPKLWKI